MSLPLVTINGTNFRADGKPFHYVGVSAFALFKRWLMHDGPAALVQPILNEWRAVAGAGGYTGPIVLRVFRFAAWWNPFQLDPWSYDFAEMTKFTQYCVDRGFYVDWTCGDAQEVLPAVDGPTGQQEHLNKTCAALVGLPTFIETVNEDFKNGIDTLRVVSPAWGGYLRDSGYYREINAWDGRNNLDFLSYHSGRDDGGLHPWPKWLIDLNDQITYITTAFGKPVVLKEPMGFDEINQPGKRSNDPDCAEAMGGTAEYGGILLHTTAGVSCDGLGPITKQCAGRFFKGVHGAIQ